MKIAVFNIFLLIILTACQTAPASLDKSLLEEKDNLGQSSKDIPLSFEPPSLEVALEAIPFEVVLPENLPFESKPFKVMLLEDIKHNGKEVRIEFLSIDKDETKRNWLSIEAQNSELTPKLTGEKVELENGVIGITNGETLIFAFKNVNYGLNYRNIGINDNSILVEHLKDIANQIIY